MVDVPPPGAPLPPTVTSPFMPRALWPSTASPWVVVPSLTPLKTYVPALESEIVLGLSLYSVSWTLTVLITAPPEDDELPVEAAVEAALVPPPEPPQPPETAATTTTTAPSRVSRCVLM